MSRRSTPERLDAANRAATVARLTLERMSQATAEAWLAAWQRQAPREGLDGSAAYRGTRRGTGSPLSVGQRA